MAMPPMAATQGDPDEEPFIPTPPGMADPWSNFNPEFLTEPMPLSGGDRELLAGFIFDELERCRNFNELVHSRGREYREQYAEYRSPKSFPWERCSNLVYSMTAPAINNTVGKLYRIIHSTKPPMQVEPKADAPQPLQDMAQVRITQNFLNAKIFEDRRFASATLEWMFDAAIIGTGLGEMRWSRQAKKAKKYKMIAGEKTPDLESYEREEFSGSELEPFRLEDLFMPAESFNNPSALQESQWVARRRFERAGEIQRKVAQGFYDEEALEVVRVTADQSDASQRSPSTFIDPTTRVSGQVDSPQHDSANELCLYHVWVRWAPTVDEEERDCYVVFHKKSKKIFRAVYNTNFHGKRPFVRLVYIPQPHSFLGRGICDQMRHAQYGANDVLNAVIDALQLANSPTFISGKQAGLKPGKNDRIWPGRWITLDEPDSFRQLDIHGPAEISPVMMGTLEKIGKQAAGVDDNMLAGGGPDGSRETAEGAGIREGGATPLVDIVVDELRRSFAEVAEMYLCNFQQWCPMGEKFKGEHFQLPLAPIPGAYQYRILASSAASNPSVKQTTLQHLLAMLAPLFQDLAQTIGAMAQRETPPPVREFLKGVISAKYSLARQMAQSFDLPSAEQLLPPLEEFIQRIAPLIDQSYQQSTQAPPPLADTVARHVFPAFINLSPEEQCAVLQMANIPIGSARKKLADMEKSGGQPPQPGGIPGGPGGGAGPGLLPPGAGGPMGGPLPPGPPGAFAPPGAMPGLPLPGGPLPLGARPPGRFPPAQR